MTRLRAFLLRLWTLARHRQIDRDIDDEIAGHLAEATDEYIQQGLSPVDARRAALRSFGGVTQTKEIYRQVRSFVWLDNFRQDLRYAGRSLRRSPGFSLAAILVLALGLGSATALFSAVDRILFRSLPYPDADRLVSVGIPPSFPGASGDPVVMNWAYVEQWSVPPEPLEAITTMRNGNDGCVITEQPPERLECREVEYNLLRVLGMQVAAGRDFRPGDGLRGAPPVALISHDLWTRRFGTNPGIMGRPLRLDSVNLGREEPVRVAGVLPADFELPHGSPADILLALRMRPAPEKQMLGFDFLGAVARLRPGVSPEEAEVQLKPRAQGMLEWFQRFPGGDSIEGMRVVPLRDRQVGDASTVAWLLLGVTAVLLLIAGVNVTNLLLARVAARDREYAIRSALGAPRGRLARLALTESLLLAVMAGGAGLALASVMLRGFVRMAPGDIPKIDQAALDLRVFVVAAGLALLVGVGIGLWPAVSVLRRNLVQGTRTTSAAHPRVRFALVSAQIALTLALLGGSALLVRSLIARVQVPLGFDSGDVVTVPLILDAARYPTEGQRAAFFEQVLERVRHAPGVETAALSAAPSPRGTAVAGTFSIEVRSRPSDPDASGPGPTIRVRDATPGYFESFRIPIESGRAFAEADRRSAEPAAVLSESLKRYLFGDQDAVGQRIRVPFDDRWHFIVGVARDVRNQGLADDSVPELYVVRSIRPDNFSGRREAYLAVRTTTRFADTVAFLTQALAEVDPLIPVTVESLAQQVAGLTERPRFVASLTSAFSGVALLLAAAGLYGVASYLVTQRSRDIGIRLTLGASPGRVSRQLIGEAGRWIIAGAGLGLLLTWATSRMLESQLFGISPTDALSIGLAAVVLLVALFLALSGPTVRAARVDPMVVLRDE